MNETLVREVEELTGPLCEEAGLELVDVEYVRENGRWFLRIYVDKPGGVTLEDCETIHGRVSRALDETDPIGHAYTLEVASPGVERRLKKESDFIRFTGQKVEVRTFVPVDGSRRIRGVLLGLERPLAAGKAGDESARTEEQGPAVRVRRDDGQEMAIPMEAVARARLLVDLPIGQKRGGSRR